MQQFIFGIVFPSMSLPKRPVLVHVSSPEFFAWRPECPRRRQSKIFDSTLLASCWNEAAFRSAKSRSRLVSVIGSACAAPSCELLGNRRKKHAQRRIQSIYRWLISDAQLM